MTINKLTDESLQTSQETNCHSKQSVTQTLLGMHLALQLLKPEPSKGFGYHENRKVSVLPQRTSEFFFNTVHAEFSGFRMLSKVRKSWMAHPALNNCNCWLLRALPSLTILNCVSGDNPSTTLTGVS